MDPITALGVAASVVQLLEVGAKVTKRLVEYIDASPGDAPKSLADIIVQLPLITKSVSTIKEESSIARYDNDTRLIIHGVVLGCLKLAQELDHIASKLSPKPGESLSLKLKKVLISLKKENRVAEIDRGLQAYIQVLILHQVVNPSDIKVGSPADVTYYEVKEVRIENPLSRQADIAKLHEAFRQASRNQRTTPEFVVLTGREGAGKTQLALEYCQEAHRAGHFRAVFWLDASDPASLRRGLESTSATIRRTRAGSTEEKLDFLRTFLSELWHSWLLVLDNYEPEAFEASNLTDLLPVEGHGAILVLTRTRQALKTAVEIKVYKVLTKEAYTSWRHVVSNALRDKQIDVLIDALSDGFDVNSRSANLWNADCGSMVDLSAECGFAEAVQLLLEMGADPYLIKHHGHVLSYATESGHVPTLKVYLEYEDRTGYCMKDDDYAYAASRAVAANEVDTLKLLLTERGDKIDRNGRWLAHSESGNQALENGAYAGHLDCIRLIVNGKKLPDSTVDRASILSRAIEGAKIEVIKYLINDVHCDPNERDHDGEPALIYAMTYGDLKSDSQDTRNIITSLLLDAGALPNVKKRSNGNTPLHIASRGGLFQTAKLLLAHGADPSIENEAGGNVLEYCSSQENSEVEQILVNVKLSDMEARRTYHNRTLFLASCKGNRVLAVQVLKEGADINAVDEATGETPLTAAIIKTQLPMARMLVRKGARQIKDKQGKSPLRLAAENDMYLLIQDLAKAKDSPGIEESDGEGYTPLMIAAKAGHRQAVNTLLSLGADTDAVNDFGETALDIAEESRDEELIAMLKGES